jgi:hypothetical protein
VTVPSQTAPELERPGMRIIGAPLPVTLTAKDGLGEVSAARAGSRSVVTRVRARRMLFRVFFIKRILRGT